MIKSINVFDGDYMNELTALLIGFGTGLGATAIVSVVNFYREFFKSFRF